MGIIIDDDGVMHKVFTKDEVIAMFEDLQSEIDEKATELCDDGWWLTYNELIQQKINSLKENKDENND